MNSSEQANKPTEARTPIHMSWSKNASNWMDHVESNARASGSNAVNVVGELTSLGKARLTVKDHGSARHRLQWTFAHIVLVLLLITELSHYSGVFAFSTPTVPAVRLRTVASSASSGLYGTSRHTDTRHVGSPSAMLPQAWRTQRQGVQAATMIDPMTVSALNRCADAVVTTATSKSPTRRAVIAAKRAAKDASTFCGQMQHTITQNPLEGTCTLVCNTVSLLATETLLSTDEDERPLQHVLLEHLSDNGIDLIDKMTAHVAGPGNLHMFHTTNAAVWGVHALDAMAMQYPVLLGITGLALVSSIVICLSMPALGIENS